MLDHISIGVSDFERSKTFYDRALRPLGITRLYADGERSAGYGISPKAFFWIGWRDTPRMGAHIAFTAQDRATVDRFHDEAIAAGGIDNGAPDYARTTIRVTMAPLSSIPTATMSRQFAIRRRASRPSNSKDREL
jgi:catechol 2,3-dioxygenase-like lactoylglutathione lyase family enzyme